jgi:hypothetical protein
LYLFASLEVDDSSKLFGVHGGSTDQASINIGLCHEGIDSIGGDGSSVLDASSLSDVVVVQFGQDGSKVGMHFVFKIIWKAQSRITIRQETCVRRKKKKDEHTSTKPQDTNTIYKNLLASSGLHTNPVPMAQTGS